jgi:hypothetical protein
LSKATASIEKRREGKKLVKFERDVSRNPMVFTFAKYAAGVPAPALLQLSRSYGAEFYAAAQPQKAIVGHLKK